MTRCVEKQGMSWITLVVIFLCFILAMIRMIAENIYDEFSTDSSEAGIKRINPYDRLHKLRLHIENAELPEYFFDNPKDVFRMLEKSGSEYMQEKYAPFFEKFYEGFGKLKPYTKEDFQVFCDLETQMPDLELLCLTMPEPSAQSECAEAYFVLVKERTGYYFLLEREQYEEETKYHLCEWDADGNRTNHGEIVKDREAVCSRIKEVLETKQI